MYNDLIEYNAKSAQNTRKLILKINPMTIKNLMSVILRRVQREMIIKKKASNLYRIFTEEIVN